MYDSIECKCWLPMSDDPKGYTGSFGFQTKDFDCALDLYIIDKNEKLYIERRETEWIERNPEAKNFLDKAGYAKTKKVWIEPLDLTCTIQFYDYFESDYTDYDYWIEYKAEFVRGKLIDMKLFNFEATSNLKRKKKNEEFQNKMRQHNEFIKTRKYKYLIRPYNKSIKFIFKKLYKILNHASINIWRIENLFLIK